MDKEIRNRIQRATQAARRLLEQECAAQLEGIFDILPDGTIKPEPGAHLGDADRITRAKIVAAIEHRRAGGMAKVASVADYTREAAFTILNRFVALKMLEARSLILESVSRGEQSSGFGELGRLAPGLADLPDHGYRLYLECLFDELGREIGVLFDRRDPASLLWPRRQPFADLLAILNDPDLPGVWQEDETIGWVYQYFNTDSDRERARYDDNGRPKAPQNSYELAVRNQFFTPRYVVQFLTDNTLGRIWYEMRQGRTRLADRLEYLVRRPNEIFLTEGEEPPAEDLPDGEELSQEERLKKPPIRFRAKKDPRDLRILDPACGSGHFLLYAFDLLLTTYEEAWADEASPRSELTGRTLREDYPDLDELRRALPGLILRHNLHGVEIDPRCAQIAALALWMRAQRAFNDCGIRRAERPLIAKTNVVIAEPMPGEQNLLEEFLRELREDWLESLIREALSISPEKTVRATKAMADSLADLVRSVWIAMERAGELGSLLKIELRLQHAIAEGQREWEDRLPLFRVVEYGLGGQTKENYVRFAEGRDQDFWSKAEQLTLLALQRYAAKQSTNGRGTTRQLFAEDAEQGFALADICRNRFDVVLMNPPFGAGSLAAKREFEASYPRTKNDLYAAFVEHGIQLLHRHGLLGAITSRTGFFLSSFQKWREEILLGEAPPVVFADLGYGVLDSAMVEVAAYCLEKSPKGVGMRTIFLRALEEIVDKESALRSAVARPEAARGRQRFEVDPMSFGVVPRSPFAYWVSERMRQLFKELPAIESDGRVARVTNPAGDDTRFFRAWWEPLTSRAAGRLAWVPLSKGGSFAQFYFDVHLVVRWDNLVQSYFGFLGTEHRPLTKPASLEFFFRPGLTWPRRTKSELSLRVMPTGCIFADKGPGIFVDTDDSETLLAVLAIGSSKAFRALVEFQLAAADAKPGGAAHSYEVGVIQRTPVPRLNPEDQAMLANLAGRAWAIKRGLDTHTETSHAFTLPALLQVKGETLAIRASTWTERVRAVETKLAALQAEIDERCFDLYGLVEADRRAITESFGGNVKSDEPLGSDADDDAEVDEDDTLLAAADAPALAAALVSWLVAVAFGRFDVRLATGEREPPLEADPFDPLPPCSPGMLTGQDGLPLEAPPAGYPVAFPRSGLLADDPGDQADLTGRVHAVFDCVFGTEADRFWGETTHTLGDGDDRLRRWLGRSLFDDTIRRYSKSRRKAPIYWQLATPSASYSIWLYYHRLTKDTFYTVLSDHIDPKLQHEERRLGALLADGGGSPNAGQRRQIAEQETLVAELRTFREETARIAPLWNPNHDDGVIINFAPLWRLVPQHRAWQRECKACWDKLVAGDYEWSHLAMHLWPERVVPKCADDRSLAIAHRLEEVFWFDDADGKWKKRQVPGRPIEELVHERTSPAVKAALKSLLEAPAANGGSRRGRKRASR